MEWTMNEKSKYKTKLDNEKQTKRAGIHSFHRYFGKLIPAIPSAFIKEFTNEGDLVGDLFSGSGTVAVESKLLGRNFIGVEINPLAQFISLVKTNNYSVKILDELNNIIEKNLFDLDYCKNLKKGEVPYCININHWFKDNVIEDMVLIKSVVDDVIDNYNFKKINKNDYKNFYYCIISSIIRNVSNADPQHVFPGISKRVRKLEEEGKIHKDAKKTFINTIKKKAKYFQLYEENSNSKTKINILNGDSTNADTKKYNGKVSLFVTNPPYISSVRYIETMKLEMYWLQYIKSSEDYSNLARKMIGNDKVTKKETSEFLLTNYEEINLIIEEINEKSSKDAHIVAKYFNDMEKIIIKMNKMLKLNGKVVTKISDSNVKKVKVETGKFLTLIAENHGFKLLDVFDDKINNNSRSLTTARNSYSNIILSDNIIIWEKVNNE